MASPSLRQKPHVRPLELQDHIISWLNGDADAELGLMVRQDLTVTALRFIRDTYESGSGQWARKKVIRSTVSVLAPGKQGGPSKLFKLQ